MSSYSNGYGYGYSSSTSTSYDYGSRNNPDFQSICDDIYTGVARTLHNLGAYINGRGKHKAWNMLVRGGQQARRNLVRRRLLSFPHLLVALWVLVMLWGERWIFASKVRSCDWDHWEDWPAGSTPHRLIFVADPQIIDPHSYPGRPWPLNSLTITITDNYMRRSYKQLQKFLRPDTVFFLGDLFDGGREWKTDRGDFEDPEWAKDHRPDEEKRLLGKWRRDYGQNYWLKEYARFGGIFYDNWNLGGAFPGSWQRGRKLISSLPGNHDLGFGAEVKIPARHRFNAYFGETNRVDVIGNHTFVSVDSLSLSAGTSIMKDQVDLQSIYAPVHEFLKGAKTAKRKAVEKEVRFWRGETEDLAFPHRVEDLSNADYSDLPTMDPGAEAPEFPTILLTHVPLYRDPGTPCGPMREHWPPAKPPKGQTTPVVPDHRNAISVSHGYQYQNVLSDEDSISLVKSIGNVIHAFSGDDHDYCELVHSDAQENVREITVKSFSMAMGVPTPGFQMVSLYNPIDARGDPLPGSPKTTLQTHLCLLPNQLSMFMTYAVLGVLTALVLVARAFLVPVLNLQPFALEPRPQRSAYSAVLPVFKAKAETPDDFLSSASSAKSSAASKFPSSRISTARTRGQSLSSGVGGGGARNDVSKGGKWGWGSNGSGNGNFNRGGGGGGGPRIEIRKDAYYDEARSSSIIGGGGIGIASGGGNGSGSWRPATRPKASFGLIVREIWTTCWRVAWMVGLWFAWLTHKG
ncbi:hypothetical protein F4778DRAFT_747587 [Xylariomycetidae sp. FL2044]|nr:hypothetical protein F4778DRAFT_747587 [Xylariomycetidae sp. FL2044]